MKLTYQVVVYSKKNSKSIITNRRTGSQLAGGAGKVQNGQHQMRNSTVLPLCTLPGPR